MRGCEIDMWNSENTRSQSRFSDHSEAAWCATFSTSETLKFYKGVDREPINRGSQGNCFRKLRNIFFNSRKMFIDHHISRMHITRHEIEKNSPTFKTCSAAFESHSHLQNHLSGKLHKANLDVVSSVRLLARLDIVR